MIKKIDPRAKLFLVVCLSTLGIVIENLGVLFTILAIKTIIAILLKANIILVLKKLRKMFYLIIGIVILQSIFVETGNVLIGFKNIKILTDIGLLKGLGYLFRIMIIFMSGTIIATSNMRELIQGLIQLKLPYEIAFMVSVGIKFLPLLIEELKDTLIAIQLRGIDIDSLRLRRKLDIYTYIFTPVIVGTLIKAKQISISIEARGFRAFKERTSIKILRFKSIDYIVIAGSILITVSIIYWNWAIA